MLVGLMSGPHVMPAAQPLPRVGVDRVSVTGSVAAYVDARRRLVGNMKRRVSVWQMGAAIHLIKDVLDATVSSSGTQHPPRVHLYGWL